MRKGRVRRDTQGTWHITAYLGLITFAAMALMATSARAAEQWAVEPAVYYNSTGAPQSPIDGIQYSLWSVRERTGQSGHYAGTTTESAIAGAVVVRWIDASAMWSRFGCQCNGYAHHVLDGAGYFAGTELLLNSDVEWTDRQLKRTIVHEFGHVFGYDTHHGGLHGVYRMVGAEPYDYALTTADVLKLPYNDRSLCHAELTTEFDIYLPDINMQSAMLRYQGNMTWTLDYLHFNYEHQNCTQASIDSQGVIKMTDVRGMGGNLTRVELVPIADDTWTLQWAE